MTEELDHRLIEDYGLHLSSEGIKTLQEASGATTPQELYQFALGYDLRSYGAAYVAKEIMKGPNGTLKGKNLFQVQNVRDVTCPSRRSKDDDEDASFIVKPNNPHRLLRLELTDGHKTLVAVELHTLASIKKIPTPGMKVLLANAQLKGGLAILTDKTFSVVGGNVSSLEQEYLLAQEAARSGVDFHGKRATDGDGPPPFVPFKSCRGGVQPPTKITTTKTTSVSHTPASLSTMMAGSGQSSSTSTTTSTATSSSPATVQSQPPQPANTSTTPQPSHHQQSSGGGGGRGGRGGGRGGSGNYHQGGHSSGNQQAHSGRGGGSYNQQQQQQREEEEAKQLSTGYR
eukprot:TRINITY_DN35872_c0_g1_i1.p1 TRINITY_DN35872_c0_g1~~TRINITY_DN35872_c0_g1_i1.p1  ORF type:complete len:352 (+),score=48.99 TRINITY_DN35872_c0_g1_i1:28-1056(+)